MLKKLLKVLRRDVPTLFPVRVRVSDRLDSGCLGVCHFRTPKEGNPYFSIILRPRMGRNLLEYVLLEEWAHAVGWTDATEDHGPEFGLAYARCRLAIEAAEKKKELPSNLGVE